MPRKTLSTSLLNREVSTLAPGTLLAARACEKFSRASKDAEFIDTSLAFE